MPDSMSNAALKKLRLCASQCLIRGRARLLYLGALMAMLSACSQPSETIGSLMLDEFAKQMSIAECESVASCPDRGHALYPISIAAAISSACAQHAQAPVEFEEMAARGHTALRLDAAEACLDALRSCGPFRGACELAFKGSLKEGAGCVHDAECASGRCDGDRNACGQCTAELAQPLSLGEPCRSSKDCAQAEDATVHCLSGGNHDLVCTKLRGVSVGEACDAPGVFCEPGTFCDRQGVCRVNLRAGEACPMNERCELGTLCIGVDLEDEVRECVAVRLRQAGESCEMDDFALSDAGTLDVCDPSQDLRCDASSLRCAKISWAAEGASCASTSLCAEGLFCDETERCVRPRPDGASCDATPQCESRRCANQRCQAPLSCAAP